jgi:hypothetical protein
LIASSWTPTATLAHAAVLDEVGGLLGDAEFPATAGGYRALLGWMRSHGRVRLIGIEGTGSYGAGLTRYSQEHKVASSGHSAGSTRPTPGGIVVLPSNGWEVMR